MEAFMSYQATVVSFGFWIDKEHSALAVVSDLIQELCNINGY